MKKIVWVFIIWSVFISNVLSANAADVKIKFIVLNPSDKKTAMIPVKYPLPRELTPDDIIDSGDLAIEYDIEQSAYCAMGQIELGPKETKVYIIRVKDVWKIPVEEMEDLQVLVEDRVYDMEGTKNYKTAKSISNSIIKRLGEIKSSQAEGASIGERVESYKINRKIMDSVENDIVSIESLGSGESSEENIITITIEVRNPYDKQYDFPVKYYLPPEISVNDIHDTAGLTVDADALRDQLFVRGEVTLNPGETKTFDLKIQDIWKIKKTTLDNVTEATKRIEEQLVGTEFEKIGSYLARVIEKKITGIDRARAEGNSIKDRIAFFKDNMQKLGEAKEQLDKLRNFMLQYELAKIHAEGKTKDVKKDMTFGGGKAEGKGGGVGRGMGSALGKGRGQTSQESGGGVKAIRGLKGLVLVSQTLFRGWKPELATTWIIIAVIIGFLFVFALLFFIIYIIISLRQKQAERMEAK